MDMRKLIAIGVMTIGVKIHAVTPGMVTAFLQQVAGYAPAMESYMPKASMSYITKSGFQETVVQGYFGVRGFSYEQTGTGSSFELKYLWDPYRCKNIAGRVLGTMVAAVCTSSIIDLLFKRRSFKEICTTAYLARAAVAGAGGALIGIALKK